MRLMKLLFCCLLATLPLAARNDRPAKSRPAPKTPAPLALPKDAVETEPGSWRHTDRQGRKWVYRKTPFGLTRYEDKPDAARPEGPNPSELISAVEDGDFAKFERPGPFGPYRWRKKIADLDEVEKAALERGRAKAKQE